MNRLQLQNVTNGRPLRAFALLPVQHRADSVAYATALAAGVTAFFDDLLFGDSIAGFARAAAVCDEDKAAEAAAFVARVVHALHGERCEKYIGRSADVSDWVRTTEIITHHMYRAAGDAAAAHITHRPGRRRATSDELAKATLHALDVFLQPQHAAHEAQGNVAAGNYTNYVGRLLNDAEVRIWEALAGTQRGAAPAAVTTAAV